eukprot:3302611-Amphidinium_carterae.1
MEFSCEAHEVECRSKFQADLSGSALYQGTETRDKLPLPKPLTVSHEGRILSNIESEGPQPPMSPRLSRPFPAFLELWEGATSLQHAIEVSHQEIRHSCRDSSDSLLPRPRGRCSGGERLLLTTTVA